jgi:hypothetical protein
MMLNNISGGWNSPLCDGLTASDAFATSLAVGTPRYMMD